jgi:hypothetical protein
MAGANDDPTALDEIEDLNSTRITVVVLERPSTVVQSVWNEAPMLHSGARQHPSAARATRYISRAR